MNDIEKEMMEFSRLCDENDKIYHLIAQQYNLPDSLYWILYVLYDADRPVSQVDLCNDWFFSKQTVNSSINAMVKKGWATLESIPGGGKRKSIRLTETGKDFCGEVIGKTRQMEENTFLKFTPEERKQLLVLLQKVNRHMYEEYEKSYGSGDS